MTSDGWKKKFKGSERGGAYVYTHQLLSRAIVVNHHGIKYNGEKFVSLDEAKCYAISAVKD